MKKKYPLHLLCLLATFATSAFAGVSVTAPANNSAVATTVQYVASATTSCAKGVSAMGIALFTVGFQAIKAALANPAVGLRSE